MGERKVHIRVPSVEGRLGYPPESAEHEMPQSEVQRLRAALARCNAAVNDGVEERTRLLWELGTLSTAIGDLHKLLQDVLDVPWNVTDGSDPNSAIIVPRAVWTDLCRRIRVTLSG